MKNMIGIMQGRVVPYRLDILQLFPKDTWQNELNEIDCLGFDSVELLFDKDLVLEKLLRQLETEAFLRSFLKAGIPLPYSVCLDFFTDLDLNADSSDAGWNKLIEIIKVFADSQVKVIVLPLLKNNTADELKSLLKRIQNTRIDKLCHSLQMELSLEINISATGIISVFDLIQLDNVGICYDFGNSRAKDRIPEDEILMLRGVINHIHVKDTNESGNNVILGQGRVELDKCLRALKEIEYKGQLILETAYFQTPRDEAKKNLHTIKSFLKDI